MKIGNVVASGFLILAWVAVAIFWIIPENRYEWMLSELPPGSPLPEDPDSGIVRVVFAFLTMLSTGIAATLFRTSKPTRIGLSLSPILGLLLGFALS